MNNLNNASTLFKQRESNVRKIQNCVRWVDELFVTLRKCHNWYSNCREDVVGKHDTAPPLLLEPKRNDLPRGVCNSDKLSFTRIFSATCSAVASTGRAISSHIILTKGKTSWWREQKSDSVPGSAQRRRRYNPPGNLNNNSHLNI
jgi:hypothetical protein